MLLKTTVIAVSLGMVFGVAFAQARPPASVSALRAWHQEMRRLAPPETGCFHASYPSVKWIWNKCNKTNYRSTPHFTKTGNAGQYIVGNGNDYVAETSGFTNSATGSFPTVDGVTSEVGSGGYPGYTLQLNTDISPSSPACGAYGYSTCQVWQQFIYSSYAEGGNAQVFMQNWLFIPNGASCPSGWNSYDTTSYVGCYRNSSADDVPTVPVTALASVQLSGSATPNGNDAVTFVYGSSAYSVSEADTTLDVSYVWNQSEFNVFGNGGGSEAEFNSDSLFLVYLQVNDGSTDAPTCLENAGTTGETNNLSLDPCNAGVYGGSEPYIEFYETNPAGYLLPPRLTAALIGSNSSYRTYKLSWTEVPGATSYDLWYRNSKVGAYTNGGPIDQTSLEVIVSIGQSIYYKVQACNSAGCGAFSDIAFVYGG